MFLDGDRTVVGGVTELGLNSDHENPEYDDQAKCCFHRVAALIVQGERRR